MSEQYSKEIRSTVTDKGNIEISITKVDMPVAADDEVLIKVHAAPINPSDLGLLLSFAADLSNINVSGSGEGAVTSIKIHPALMGSMKPRLNQSMPVGNEGAGVIIDAGVNAKALIAKTVGLTGTNVSSIRGRGKISMVRARTGRKQFKRRKYNNLRKETQRPRRTSKTSRLELKKNEGRTHSLFCNLSL